MVSPYRRLGADCAHKTNIRRIRCKCPIQVQGTLDSEGAFNGSKFHTWTESKQAPPRQVGGTFSEV